MKIECMGFLNRYYGSLHLFALDSGISLCWNRRTSMAGDGRQWLCVQNRKVYFSLSQFEINSRGVCGWQHWTMPAAARELGFEFYGCFPHAINLIVQTGLSRPEISLILKKMRSVRKIFKYSSPVAKKFANVAQEGVFVQRSSKFHATKCDWYFLILWWALRLFLVRPLWNPKGSALPRHVWCLLLPTSLEMWGFCGFAV